MLAIPPTILPIPTSWASAACISSSLLFLIYLASLVIYRLYWSPLAKIPGPKLAAATFWYEFYYDVIRRGRYTWKIGELHEEYGPIVRINPFEVHINDPDYYHHIYSGPSKRREKWAWSAAMFGTSSSHFSTVPHELHRRRRAPLNHFFSRASVLRLEPMVRNVVEHLCSRLEGFRDTKEPVNLRHAFAAVAMDVVTEYAFGTSYKCLDDPLFAPMWPEAVDSVSEQSHLNKQFPWLLPLMRRTPLWLVEKLNPHIMRLIKLQIDLSIQVQKLMMTTTDQQQDQSNANKTPSSSSSSNHPTIFHELLQPDSLLPTQDRTLTHLVGEAQAIVAAGQVTTTHFLNTTAFHILSQPKILSKLQLELNTAISPDGRKGKSSSLPPLQTLEQLPYLSAIILEGYRLSYGVTHRLQRISPDEDLIYEDKKNQHQKNKIYVIPRGTPMSMTSIFMHENPEIFPRPKEFEPERWLDSSSGSPSDGSDDGAKKHLANYLVNFSKGTRGCLGQHLASAEIHLTLAAIFCGKFFELELYGTTREDVDVEHDFFNPQPKRGAVGVRVFVN